MCVAMCARMRACSHVCIICPYILLHVCCRIKPEKHPRPTSCLTFNCTLDCCTLDCCMLGHPWLFHLRLLGRNILNKWMIRLPSLNMSNFIHIILTKTSTQSLPLYLNKTCRGQKL